MKEEVKNLFECLAKTSLIRRLWTMLNERGFEESEGEEIDSTVNESGNE